MYFFLVVKRNLIQKIDWVVYNVQLLSINIPYIIVLHLLEEKYK